MAAALQFCCGGLAGVAMLLLCFSWASVAPTEMALRYNYVLKTISPEVVSEPGLKFVGPFVSLVKYPKTIQTLEYNQAQRDLLDGRTKDGLPLILGTAFQYRLLPDGLYNLYHSFENTPGDYEKIFHLMGIHIITEVATKFTAYQFFNEKQAIAAVMRNELDAYFVKNLHATVESLQINEDDLPEAFTETILMAATSKQNITKMEKTRDAKVIEFQTVRLVSLAQANVTVQHAIGDQHRIMQNGRADAAIIEAYVEAELQAYGKVHDELGLSGDRLLKYIWYDTLSGGSVSADATQTKDIQMLFGINPAAYISETAA